MKTVLLLSVLTLSGCVTAKNEKSLSLTIEGVGELKKEVKQEVPWLTNVGQEKDTEVGLVKTTKNNDGTTTTLAISFRETTSTSVDQSKQEGPINNAITNIGTVAGGLIGWGMMHGNPAGLVGGGLAGHEIGETVGEMVDPPAHP